ncbi:YwqH-like family protein [Bhargavaea beijingensis]|uniref:DUF5082 domain-containing protein n=1 Tax=Bhargavaea beijingensis TaxID=426756 RepID=A0A1G6ZQQ6_9BACL|nr:DUF5082 family protein [Bhargavaea beijingensis]MCW1928788.1 DUF5082 domain-containing protein [Bhargavaea beijingensis]RSK35733.1 DUF5082 domain-containing protein [Bhargavaea beijingensis]SDE04713.1 protein of unknown function [Bhargavaea beijingensis]
MISYYQMLVEEKRQQVRRLNSCRGELQGKQGEFQQSEPKCMEPELTPKTWHGNLAKAFDEIRQIGIKTPYRDVSGPQFDAAYAAISVKITKLEAEIASLEAIIAQLRAAEAAARAAKS